MVSPQVNPAYDVADHADFPAINHKAQQLQMEKAAL